MNICVIRLFSPHFICFSTQLDVYSATLYDSLLTYAMAAKKIKDDYYLAHSTDSDADKISAVTELVKNGTQLANVSKKLELIWNCLWFSDWISINGNWINI